MDWEAKHAWAVAEHDRRAATPPSERERDDLRLAGIAGASWAAGLACAMLGRRAREFWQRAHTLEQMRDRYLEVLAKALESPPAETPAGGKRPAHLTDTCATRLDALVRDLHVGFGW